MSSERSDLLAALTMCLWLTCLGAGVAGYCIPAARPQARAADVPVQAQFIKVTLGRAPRPAPRAGAVVAKQTPPPLPALMTSIPAPAAFVDPLPAPAPVAAPVTAPVTASVVNAKSEPAVAQPAVTQLVYGQGEGAQPAPEYPREAALAGEEGTVVVIFTVDENGNVQTAEAVNPCQWPILNEAALRSIRQTWNFGAGPPRRFEIAITYRLESP